MITEVLGAVAAATLISGFVTVLTERRLPRDQGEYYAVAARLLLTISAVTGLLAVVGVLMP